MRREGPAGEADGLGFLFLVLAAVGLHCCAWAFSSCGQGVSGRGPRGILRDKSISQCGCYYFQHPNPPFPGVTNSTAWAGRSFFPAGLLFWTRDVTHASRLQRADLG